jgi:acyl-coenzyme A thioesterase PaaI-like protein
VHGGVSALILDQMLGEAAAAGRAPGMTGSLRLRYRKPTPLGDLSAEAWVDRVEDIKTTVVGQIKDSDGEPTVEAEGLFILPRWAREAMTRNSDRPPRFE